jgi:hypothetical protein
MKCVLFPWKLIFIIIFSHFNPWACEWVAGMLASLALIPGMGRDILLATASRPALVHTQPFIRR